MRIRFTLLCCLCIVFIVLVTGCSSSNESSTNTSVQDTKDSQNTKDKDTSNPSDSSFIDKNCVKVYSEKECKQFAAYYKSEEGQEDSTVNQASSGTQQETTDQTHKIYNTVAYVVKRMFNAPDRTNVASYEDSIISRREDGLYYISSSYVISGTGNQQDAYYEFEMLMNDNYELVDAYFPGSYGRFSRPMVYDKLKNYTAPPKQEVSPEEQQKQEEENQKVMESIYGNEAMEGTNKIDD